MAEAPIVHGEIQVVNLATERIDFAENPPLIALDSSLDIESTNPVRYGAVAEAISALAPSPTFYCVLGVARTNPATYVEVAANTLISLSPESSLQTVVNEYGTGGPGASSPDAPAGAYDRVAVPVDGIYHVSLSMTAEAQDAHLDVDVALGTILDLTQTVLRKKGTGTLTFSENVNLDAGTIVSLYYNGDVAVTCSYQLTVCLVQQSRYDPITGYDPRGRPAPPVNTTADGTVFDEDDFSLTATYTVGLASKVKTYIDTLWHAAVSTDTDPTGQHVFGPGVPGGWTPFAPGGVDANYFSSGTYSVHFTIEDAALVESVPSQTTTFTRVRPFDADAGEKVSVSLDPRDGFARSRLTMPDNNGLRNFGESVATNGSLVVVTAVNPATLTVDTVYVIDTDKQVGDPGYSRSISFDTFGPGVSSVAIDGDNLFVGVPGRYLTNKGTVNVYNARTGDPTGAGALFDREAEERDTYSFGASVAIDGDIVVVGAPNDNADISRTRTGAAFVFRATTGEKLAKLVATDGAAYDNFGSSVAIDGNYIVVGASLMDDDEVGMNVGAVYVFDRSSYAPVHKLLPSDAEVRAQFGQEVILDGTTLVVRAYQDYDYAILAYTAMKVYVFDLTNADPSLWQQTILSVTLPPYNRTTHRALAMDASYIYVGAALGNDARGVVHTFARQEESHPLVSSTLLQPDDTYYVSSNNNAVYSTSRFGTAVALSGTTVVVSAPAENNDMGGVYVFRPSTYALTLSRPEVDYSLGQIGYASPSLQPLDVSYVIDAVTINGTAVEGVEFAPLPAGGSQEVSLPSSLNTTAAAALAGGLTRQRFTFPDYVSAVCAATSGSLMVVTALNPTTGTVTMVYVIDTEKEVSDDGYSVPLSPSRPFGAVYGVAIDGNTVVVGDTNPATDLIGSTWGVRGVVYVFDASTGQQKAFGEHTSELTPSDVTAGDNFGTSVAIDSDIVVVGSNGMDENKGAVYVFDATTGVQVRLAASDGAEQDSFGYSVAISGNYIVVGAPFGDDGESSGAVYLFNRAGYDLAKKLVQPTYDPRSKFGVKVAIDGDTVVVRGYYTVHVFDLSNDQLVELSLPTIVDYPSLTIAIGAAYIYVGYIGWGADVGSVEDVYIFERQSPHALLSSTKLEGDESHGQDTPSYFGAAIVASGTTIVVSAPSEDDNLGGVYVFRPAANEAVVSFSDSYGRVGASTVNVSRYDAQGYDANGYDANGYDANGYDTDGFNADGLNAQGHTREYMVVNRMDFVNIQFPVEPFSITMGQGLFVYSRGYKEGVTEADGPGAGVKCWIGYSTTNATSTADFANADWTWVQAEFYNDRVHTEPDGTEIGVCDTFKATIIPSTAGRYHLVSRWQLNSGPFTYGGIGSAGSEIELAPSHGGFWDGSTNISATLDVNP